MLYKLIFNKIGAAAQNLVIGAGLIAVTTATGVVVYNVMSGDSGSNTVNTAQNYSAPQYVNQQVGSAGVSTDNIADAVSAASKSGYVLNRAPQQPNTNNNNNVPPSPAPPSTPVTTGGGSAPSSPDDIGAANTGLLESIGAQAKAQREGQNALADSLNQQVADAQSASARAQADAAAKFKSFGGLESLGLKGGNKPGGSSVYVPNNTVGDTSGKDKTRSAEEQLARSQIEKMKDTLNKATTGRLTGFTGNNPEVTPNNTPSSTAGTQELKGAGAQAAAIREKMNDLKSKMDVPSTSIADAYLNAGDNPASIAAVSGDSSGGATSGVYTPPTTNQIAKSLGQSSVDNTGIELQQKKDATIKTRANVAWWITAADAAIGLTLCFIISMMSMTTYVKWIVAGAGIALMGVAMYLVLKNHGDGAEINQGQKWAMGMILGAVAVAIGLTALSTSINSAGKVVHKGVSQAFQWLGKQVGGLFGKTFGGFFKTSFGKIIGKGVESAATTGGSAVVNHVKSGISAEKDAKDAYDAAKNAASNPNKPIK